ncbi:hypothetical protein [Methylobacterium gregans]|uniref:Uncharacterized protein n=1 Tax=Methylobacterium gregans TaxID=374424 RepID=A0AA37HNA2_9HYPH|nr:hypothetical protein [Methylobacterium gregans]MDQ0523089.1 hypothetical protein [Methylobacterium gregans]GJD78575.1 hypothetical protein NBEOAGPD_1792 [Methylobacterium gregans]
MPGFAYNLRMLSRRTHLSLCIAVGSTLILTMIAAVALFWP